MDTFFFYSNKNTLCHYRSIKDHSFADMIKDEIFIYFDRKKKKLRKIEKLQVNKMYFS